MNEYSDSFEFLQEHSAEFKERQALSRVSNSIVECRWRSQGVCAQWREIANECATPWNNVYALPGTSEQRISIQIDLDALSHEKAIRIGEGDATEGIRKALAQYLIVA